MKDKLIVLIVAICVAAVLLCAFACSAEASIFNKALIDTTWSFEYAYVYSGTHLIACGKVQSWKDFENSDCVQVKIKDKVYLTHFSNVILVSE
jgi:hypothetical protein